MAKRRSPGATRLPASEPLPNRLQTRIVCPPALEGPTDPFRGLYLSDEVVQWIAGRSELAISGRGAAAPLADAQQWSPAIGSTARLPGLAGAFALDAGSSDTAMLLWLEPGVYTATVQAPTSGISGLALIEVYQTD